MRHVLILPALLLVSACEMPTTSPPMSEPTDTCGASDFSERFLGLSQEEVQAAALPNARIIPPNSAVTLDFQADRVNVELDAQGRVSRVYCG